MIKKSLLIILIGFLSLAGCVKSSVNLNNLSDNTTLTPSIVIAGVKGTVTLANLIEPDDTLIIDTDNSIKLVYRLDSVIDFTLEDFYTPFPSEVLNKSFIMLGPDIVNIQENLIIDPGDGIKLKEMDVISGAVGYTITSGCNFDTEIHLRFNSIRSGSEILERIITVGAESTVSGNIALSGRVINFDSDPLNPYNRIPVTYSIYALDDPGVIFDNNIDISISFSEPQFNYAKGYFGLQQTTATDIETFDTGMEDFFSVLTGSIYLSNPSININYQNSFGMPLRVVADVSGENEEESIQLTIDPIDLDYPTSEVNRTVTSSIVVNRDNSNLPDVISMLPHAIYFGGSATSNPEGETGEDNIVFQDSHFNADIEVEVPFEFRSNDLQLSDTIDNFLIDRDSDGFILDVMTSLRLNFFVENGFPLGGDITLSLYDSISRTIFDEVTTGEMFKPAEVNDSGRVISPTQHNSFVELNNDFISMAENADQIIISFTLYTTDHGSRDVKIYSDYNLKFKAGLSFSANLQID